MSGLNLLKTTKKVGMLSKVKKAEKVFYVCFANVIPVLALSFHSSNLTILINFFRIFQMIYCFKLIFHCVLYFFNFFSLDLFIS